MYVADLHPGRHTDVAVDEQPGAEHAGPTGHPRIVDGQGAGLLPAAPQFDVVAALEGLPVSGARLEGELIATDARGRSDFSALQRALEAGDDARLRYLLFDLPALEDVDLTRVPLAQRKALLADVLATAKARATPLAFSTHVEGHGADVFTAAKRHGLEGIVSKRIDSPYSAGRSRDWLKIKHALSDEFVIVGYTAPKGSRSGFGSLLLARVDDSALHYVGREPREARLGVVMNNNFAFGGVNTSLLFGHV